MVHQDEDSLKGFVGNEKLLYPVEESSKSRFSGKLRYWWAWTVASVLMLIIGPPCLSILWLIRKKHWLYPFAAWGADKWLRACGAKIKVSGLENLDKDRHYILVANHRSYLDTAAIFIHSGRKIGLVAKKELYKIPIMGQGMPFVNIIAIDRSNQEKARESIERARKVMEAGSSFGVFAEGTRAMPGELLPFKKGAFHLALGTGAPIVPVAIKNTDWMMGKRCGVAFPGTIEMVFLPPIETAGYDTDSLMELLIKTRSAIAHELGDFKIAED